MVGNLTPSPTRGVEPETRNQGVVPSLLWERGSEVEVKSASRVYE